MLHLNSRLFVLCLAIFFLSVPAASFAEDTSETIVDVAAICTGISSLEPVGFGESFPVSAGKLFCFTRIVSKQIPITITHVWYYGQTERARVDLTVKSVQWRTYSSKIILPEEIGSWHVDVLDPAGNLLRRIEFTVTSDDEAAGETGEQSQDSMQQQETAVEKSSEGSEP